MRCSVLLYHMGSLFAQVWYSPEDNQIALVHGFERRKILEPYLEVIELEGADRISLGKPPPVRGDCFCVDILCSSCAAVA